MATTSSHQKLRKQQSVATINQSVEDAVEVWKDLVHYPTVTKAKLSNRTIPGHISIYSEWSQKNLERGEKVKFSRNHIAHLDEILSITPININSELLSEESPSGKYKAVLRSTKDKKGEDQQYIEIWSGANSIQNVSVADIEQHGKIYEDGTFGCFEWSHSETHLLYVAERKCLPPKSFFDKKAMLEELVKGRDETARGEQNVYKENWGEQLVGKCHSVLCILDIESGLVSTLDNLPDNISPGQAIWCPDDQGVVCVGWDHTPYRLGLVYCPIRKNALYHLDLRNMTCNILVDDYHAIRCPSFSPNFSKLVYLDNLTGGPHMQCSRLVMIDWATKGVVTVIDSLRKAPAEQFQGLYNARLQRRIWATDNIHLVIDTQWRSTRVIIVINTETGTIKRLNTDINVGAASVLDVHNDLIVASFSGPNQPNYLVIGQLPNDTQTMAINWVPLDGAPNPTSGIMWTVDSIKPALHNINEKYEDVDYEYYILEPTKESETDDPSKPPLVVHLHGGPHSVMGTDFIPYSAGLCKLGFAVLAVNYRGSIGFGQDSIDSLLGNIGRQDVLDVQSCVERVLSSGKYDGSRVVVMGGSHGGFLTTHLIGQFPDFYRAAACRNPVINLASMAATTDIPDWNYVEGGLEFGYKTSANVKSYSELLAKSPIQYVDQMNTPVLLMLGAKDLRVPPSQGHELRKALLSRDIAVRVLEYQGDCHPLNTVDTEADAFVNIVHWFTTHIA